MRQNIRKWAIGLTASALSIITTVSAYSFGYADFRSASNDIIGWLQQIFGPIFAVLLGVNEFDQYLFARILLAILLFVVIYSVLKKIKLFKNYSTITVLVALIISLLGTRTLSESQFIVGILVPYGALAVALSVALPFIIYFFFIYESDFKSSGARRLLWILFGVVFISIWISRIDETNSTMNWIYFLGMILVLLCLVFDSSIKSYFGWGKHKEIMSAIDDQNRVDLYNRYQKAQKVYYESGGTNDSAEREMERIRQIFRNRRWQEPT